MISCGLLGGGFLLYYLKQSTAWLNWDPLHKSLYSQTLVLVLHFCVLHFWSSFSLSFSFNPLLPWQLHHFHLKQPLLPMMNPQEHQQPPWIFVRKEAIVNHIQSQQGHSKLVLMKFLVGQTQFQTGKNQIEGLLNRWSNGLVYPIKKKSRNGGGGSGAGKDTIKKLGFSYGFMNGIWSIVALSFGFTFVLFYPHRHRHLQNSSSIFINYRDYMFYLRKNV